MTEISQNSSSSRWIFRGKLRPPLRHLSLIERPDLIAAFDELIKYQVAVIVAPAGYGKTTSLMQWRARRMAMSDKIAWLSIDDRDNDPHRLMCYIIFSLVEAGVKLGQLESLAEQGLTDMSVESAQVALLEALESQKGNIVMILDDFHRLRMPCIDEVLTNLLNNTPRNVHIVISSRHRQNISLSHFCVTGRGIEVDAERLRFSDREITEALGPHSDMSFNRAIVSKTEGWPLAVQLARLALVDGHDVESLLRMSGSASHIAEFFSEQVVDGLSKEVQVFLTRTAILDQLNPELANAVYDGNNSWRILRQLSDLSALIVSLDQEGEWYRYHHLFADYLLARLKEMEPEQVPERHLAASRWFEENGDTFQAVRHAMEAGCCQRAADLIQNAGGWQLILYGGIGYLRNILRLLPEEVFESFPRLAIAKAYLLIKTGNIPLARAYFDRAAAAREAMEGEHDDQEAYDRDVLNIGALLSIYEDDGESAEKWRCKRLQTLPNGQPDTVTNGVLACQRATQEIYLGEYRLARDSIRQAMRFMGQANSKLGLNYCYIHSALSNFQQGNIKQAFSNAHESSNMAAGNFGRDSGLKFVSDVVLTSLMFWTSASSVNDWERFEQAMQYVYKYDGWFEVYTTALETQVERHLLSRNLQAAETCIEFVAKSAHKRGLRRLELQAKSMELIRLCVAEESKNGVAIARELAKKLPVGHWRSNRFHWRCHLFSAMALSQHFFHRNPEKSEQFILDAIDCARTLDAQFFLIRVLSLYAAQLDILNRRPEALEVLVQALESASPRGLATAVARTPRLVPLLRHAQSIGADELGGAITNRFIRNVIRVAQFGSSAGVVNDEIACLSPRELEVLMELSMGRSNKHIARTLDITEHTVKFHLKGVFRKLSVTRRTEALKVARDSGLI